MATKRSLQALLRGSPSWNKALQLNMELLRLSPFPILSAADPTALEAAYPAADNLEAVALSQSPFGLYVSNGATWEAVGGGGSFSGDMAGAPIINLGAPTAGSDAARLTDAQAEADDAQAAAEATAAGALAGHTGDASGAHAASAISYADAGAFHAATELEALGQEIGAVTPSGPGTTAQILIGGGAGIRPSWLAIADADAAIPVVKDADGLSVSETAVRSALNDLATPVEDTGDGLTQTVSSGAHTTTCLDGEITLAGGESTRIRGKSRFFTTRQANSPADRRLRVRVYRYSGTGSGVGKGATPTGTVIWQQIYGDVIPASSASLAQESPVHIDFRDVTPGDQVWVYEVTGQTVDGSGDVNWSHAPGSTERNFLRLEAEI